MATKPTHNNVNFSGGVQTQANAGTAGGTMYYINLGGIKMLWGTTASIASGSAYGITFPASFFTTIQSSSVTMYNAAGTANIECNWGSLATSSGTFNILATAGSGSMPLHFMVIGT